MKYDSQDIYAIKHQSIIELYNSKTPRLLRGRTRVTVALLAFIVWCAILVESAVRYFSLSYVDFDPAKPMFYVMCAIILAVSVAVFKPYKFFTQKSYYGKITSCSKSENRITSGLTIRERTWTHLVGAKKAVNYISVSTPNGRIKSVAVPISGHAKEIYKVGSYVSVLCGVKFPVPIDKNVISQNKRLCTSCGCLESSGHTRCSVCKETLWYK